MQQTVNTARLFSNAQHWRPDHRSESAGKANKAGTTSVDELFFGFLDFFSPAFLSCDDVGEIKISSIREDHGTAGHSEQRSCYKCQSLHSTMRSLLEFHFPGSIRQSCLTGVPECLFRAGQGLGDDVNTENE